MLNLLHLFAQQVFLLRLAHAFVDFLGNFPLDLHFVDFRGQVHIDRFQAFNRFKNREQFLLDVRLNPQIHGNQIGEAARVFDAIDHFQHIFRQGAAVSQSNFQQSIDTLHQGIDHQAAFFFFDH